MAKLKIINSNLVDSATITASSTLGIHTVSNLKKVIKSKVWRSAANSQSATLTFDLAIASTINSIILPYTNLTAQASIVVKMYASNTLVHDSGTIFPSKWSIVGTNIIKDIPVGVATYAYGGGSCATYWTNTLITGVTKVEITITNTNSTAAYIEVSSVLISKAWTPKYNTAYGASVNFKDLSTNTRNEAGDLVPTKGTRTKSIEFDLAFMDATDKEELANILRRSGSSHPVFISVYPLDTDINLEGLFQIYGYLSPSALTNVNFGLYSSQITIDEV